MLNTGRGEYCSGHIAYVSYGWVVIISCNALLYYHFLYAWLFTIYFRTHTYNTIPFCSVVASFRCCILVPLLYYSVATHVCILHCTRLLIIPSFSSARSYNAYHYIFHLSTDPGLLDGYQAGTSKVAPSITTITNNPFVFLWKLLHAVHTSSSSYNSSFKLESGHG